VTHYANRPEPYRSDGSNPVAVRNPFGGIKSDCGCVGIEAQRDGPWRRDVLALIVFHDQPQARNDDVARQLSSGGGERMVATLATQGREDGRQWFDHVSGRWVRFVVTRVPVSPEKPHGLDCSLTLHGPDGERLVGFDNAHPVAKQRAASRSTIANCSEDQSLR
jgi:hypothetical protein